MKEHRDYQQQFIDEDLLNDLKQLIRLAIREDLNRWHDVTTVSIVPDGVEANACIVAREGGTSAGLELLQPMLNEIGCDIRLSAVLDDACPFEPGVTLAVLAGDARDLLTCERTLLNFLGRLCGVATWTARHAALIADLPVRLYDTRKTTPGWRRLEKYAVRCGGGHNHRTGLFDAILIKDNHLAFESRGTNEPLRPSIAVQRARDFISDQPEVSSNMIIEVEVDSIEQLQDVLPSGPDIVLLDNMAVEELRQAVQLRNSINASVELEASGGVNLNTLRQLAETGIDRISVGALTHSATTLDLGLDWRMPDSMT